MKHTLTLAFAILLLAATGWGETNNCATTNALDLNHYMPDCSATNASEKISIEGRIKEYAASGEICKVFGHWFPNVWLSSGGDVIDSGNKCVLCGKTKVITITEEIK